MPDRRERDTGMSVSADTVLIMQTEVIRSPRRKKTVQARLVDGTLRIRIPATMTLAEEADAVADMQRRFERRLGAQDIDLPARAQRLASSLDLPLPKEIVFSERQEQRWGSCTPGDGRVRISNRLAGFPDWVIDYVIVHELAHLEELSHSARFWGLVDRYPLAERARGYLIAVAEGRQD